MAGKRDRYSFDLTPTGWFRVPLTVSEGIAAALYDTDVPIFFETLTVTPTLFRFVVWLEPHVDSELAHMKLKKAVQQRVDGVVLLAGV